MTTTSFVPVGMSKQTPPNRKVSGLAYILLCIGLAALAACSPAKSARPGVGNAPNKPAKPSDKPKYEPVDTLRWTTPSNPKPPIGAPTDNTGNPGGIPGETYHLAYLLPFLGSQYDGGAIPEKSRLALQFYAGAKLALQKVSEEGGVNLVVDVYDTQATDADFQKLTNDTRLRKAAVFIGPIRSTHVATMANWAKANRKIVVSPESPNMDLTTQNPDFIQTNPSLRAHCATIVRYVLKKHRANAVTLVCKQKEAERLAYCQSANTEATRFNELIVPDETTGFDKTNLSSYLRAGRTNVFIVPSWASQDFINAFLRHLKAIKGSNRVEVYGMPQWKSYESIEPDFYRDLNVHITAASFLDYNTPEVKAFQQAFYESTGTVPDDDAFNGYDITLFTGRALRQYGLSFPERLADTHFTGLHGSFQFNKIFAPGHLDDGMGKYDYWENGFVHVLKYGKMGFAPIEP